MRIAISILLSVVIFALTYSCAWVTVRYLANDEDGYIFHAVHEVARIEELLEQAKEENGEYPATLAELQDPAGYPLRLNEAGQCVDPWANPYIYERGVDEYKLCSHGQDGKPGGVGMYSDIYPGMLRTEYQPTLHQYHFELGTGNSVLFIGLIVGILAGVVFYFGTTDSFACMAAQAKELLLKAVFGP